MNDTKLALIIVVILSVIIVSLVMFNTKVEEPFTEEFYLNFFGVVEVSKEGELHD